VRRSRYPDTRAAIALAISELEAVRNVDAGAFLDAPSVAYAALATEHQERHDNAKPIALSSGLSTVQENLGLLL